MQKTVLTAASLAGAFACVLSSAQAGTLIPVPQVPGSTATYITGINDNNVIAGDYSLSDGTRHGFVGTLNGQYTTFDAPGGQTGVTRINNAGYVGAEAPWSMDCQISGCAYLRAPDGSFQAITRKGSLIDGFSEGMTAHGFVGQYYDYTGDNVLFVGFYGRGTRYRANLALPFNTDRIRPRGYTPQGAVVGYFRDSSSTNLDNPGFIISNGVATSVMYPDPSAYYTLLEDINRDGMISGYWTDQNSTVSQAFLYDQQAHAFSPITVPGATLVTASAINRKGVVAVEADNLPYIYCTQARGCPASSSTGVAIAEKWIPATQIHSVLCRNGCLGAQPAAAAVKPGNAAAVRAAIASDPDMQRELRLPVRR